MLNVSDNKKIGMFMLGLGAVFLFLGVLFFFDRVLMALGNMLFLGGFPFLIGFKRSLDLFNPIPSNAPRLGIAAFFGGFLLVVRGWGLLGFALELFGLLKMFGGFLASIAGYLGNLPVVGPAISACVNNAAVQRFLGMFSAPKAGPKSYV
mmetsp:Transcript_18678/g.65987  ORF Transcript_18678/g.65987 Transcript_18678/m.65987 type:complete len:150 (-) Transcript_18678:106-555(-)